MGAETNDFNLIIARNPRSLVFFLGNGETATKREPGVQGEGSGNVLQPEGGQERPPKRTPPVRVPAAQRTGERARHEPSAPPLVLGGIFDYRFTRQSVESGYCTRFPYIEAPFVDGC